MNITSNNTMIFTKEENGKVHYRAGLSTKNVKDEYESGYIDVRMPKDTQLENKTKINITKGFLSFYNYTDKENKKHTIWYIVVQEYTTKEQLENTEVYKVESYTDDQLELPF